MIRIRFFSDYIKPHKFTNHPVTGIPGVKIVNDDSYTHAVLYNCIMPELTCPKENVLALAAEPVELLPHLLSRGYLEYAVNHIGRFLIGKECNWLPSPPFTVHYSYFYVPSDLLSPIKTAPMSIVFSIKNYLPGHQYRHQLVSRILQGERDIHIYGTGCKTINNDGRIKGAFHNHGTPFARYRYTIAIENTQSQAYISEKFVLPLRYNTVPIYYGATDVDKYFGDGCHYQLCGNIDSDMSLIESIYDNWQSCLLDLHWARQSLLNGEASVANYIEKWLKDH
jgi:hypothetical protein